MMNSSYRPSGILDLTLLGPTQRRSRLLIVDDQPINIQVLYQVFASEYQVMVATSGQQALEMCRDKNPDLILLDVQMPGMNGYEVCRQIKADPNLRDLPVIFVTVHSDAKEETFGLELGAVDYIAKPFNPAVVRARVKAHLQLKLQGDLLRHLSFIDGLTGVYNRRYFDECCEQEFQRALRNANEIGLLIIDVDFFKRYNDHYGHLAGDEALRQVAAILNMQLKRPGDFVSRFGGEEFACVLPETDLEGARGLAQEVLDAVRMAHIAHACSDVGPFLTISVGCAVMRPQSGRAAAELISAADEQLYLAKSKGRGCVSCVQL